MTADPHLVPLELAGERILLDGRGAVWCPEHGTLIVADLHLAKAEAFAAAGRLLPPYDSRATLARLAELVVAHRPERVVSLGDGFHRKDGYARLAPAERAQLDALGAVTRWTWLTGNHDPEAPSGHGESAASLALGGLHLRHVPSETAPSGEIAGHLHPKAAVRIRGRRVARPCFVTDGRRLLVPAMGAFTGGLDVWEPAIADLFRGPFDVLLCGRDGRLRRLPASRLEGAPRRARSARTHTPA
ncbi:MAG: ligase-associated DNA damage response endonuclease PdeM [Pseudomonadota bacterium]